MPASRPRRAVTLLFVIGVRKDGTVQALVHIDALPLRHPALAQSAVQQPPTCTMHSGSKPCVCLCTNQ